MALGVIGATSLLVDGGARRRWAEPLRWLGVNPLGIYVSAELLDRLLELPLIRHGAALLGAKDVLFWRWLVPYVRDNGGPRSSLVYALGYAGVWVLVAGLLHRRHIMIRV
jgi:predicted acyltransferase